MDRELLKTGSREVDKATLMQFEKGYLWEVALSRAFGEKGAHRIGEIELDGIAMSPDGVQYALDTKHRLKNILKPAHIEEYKCTAISSTKPITEQWKWIMQVKGYCKALYVTKCIFHILHIRDFVPVYNVWELTFTQAELDENWQAILNHAKTMKEGQ